MRYETIERWSRYFWTILLLAAGISHFVLFDFLLAQMPPYLPEPGFLIHLSGVVEIAFALGLQVRSIRRWVWLGIALMCVAYLPVHWHVWINCEALAAANGAYHIPCWLALVRLPIQIVLIAWPAWLSGALGRPLKK